MNYNNAYVRRLMEDEPTEKEIKKAPRQVKSTPVKGETRPETIEYEKNLKKKTPKKKYFGGKSRAEDVDVPAAIKHHETGIKKKAAAAVAKASEEDEREISRRVKASERKDEAIGPVVAGAGRVLGGLGKKILGGLGKKVGTVGKKAGRAAVEAGAEGVVTAASDEARKREELRQQQASSKTLNAGSEYANAYVKALVEGEKSGGDVEKTGERIGTALTSGGIKSKHPSGKSRKERIARVKSKVAAKHSGPGGAEGKGSLSKEKRKELSAKEAKELEGTKVTKKQAASHGLLRAGKKHDPLSSRQAVKGKTSEEHAEARTKFAKSLIKGMQKGTGGKKKTERVVGKQQREFKRDLGGATSRWQGHKSP